MKRIKICDVSEQIRGVSYKPTDIHAELNKNSVILLRANNISDGKINFDEVVYVDKSKVSKKQYLKKGDILICASSGSKQLVGKAASVNFDVECTFGAFCKVVRPCEGFSDYLGVYFQSDIYRRRISELSLGANINNIKNEHIDLLEIPFCDETETGKFVHSISKVQEIIDKRKQQLQQLDDLVKARFVEMFGEVETNIKGFNIKRMDECCKFIGGAQPNKSYFEYEKTDDNIRLIQIRDYKSDRFVTYIPKTLARKTCTASDIMIGRYGPPIFQILGGIEGAYNVALMKAVPTDEFNVEYFRYFLKDEKLLHYLESFSQRTAGQDGIQIDKLNEYPCLVPSMDLQNDFAAFVEQVDKSKVAVQKALDEAQTLFDSLMQQYFG